MQNSILARAFGSMSGHSEVAVALITLLVVLVSAVCFGVIQFSGRRYHDAELADRHTLALVGSWPSQYFSWGTRPLLASQLCAFQRLMYAQSVLDEKNARPVTHDGVGFSRSALAASLATVVDFAFALWFVQLGMNAAIATVIGCGLGAVFNFSVNRIWTFENSGAPALAMSRYALVSTFRATLQCERRPSSSSSPFAGAPRAEEAAPAGVRHSVAVKLRLVGAFFGNSQIGDLSFRENLELHAKLGEMQASHFLIQNLG